MSETIPRSSRDNLRHTLTRQCAEAGGQAQWGRAHGFSKSYVCDVLSGRRDISDAVAIALGFLLIETAIPVRAKPKPASKENATGTPTNGTDEAQAGKAGPLPRCGDHVFHEPSGEHWLVAYADDFVLAPAGCPDSRAKTASCTIVKRCTEEEHAAAVNAWRSAKGDGRRAMVLRLYDKQPLS